MKRQIGDFSGDKNHRRYMLRLLAIALMLGGGWFGCAGPLFPLGKTTAPHCVFIYEGHARSVCMAGDFNGWSIATHCLRREKERWVLDLTLEPGVYRYVFVIDGTHWIADPRALFFENDGFGQRNAVVVVQ